MFNTSRERIREIEAKAIRKIKNFPKNYSTEDLKKLEEELKKQDEIFLKNLELMDFSDLNTPQEDLQLNKDEKSDPFDDIEDEESEVFDDIEEEEDIHGI